MIALKEKPGELFKVNVWLGEDSLKLKSKWTREVGREEKFEMALHETNRQLESQQMELYHANQWACQAQMENRRIFVELAIKSRLYKKVTQKIVRN